MVFGSVPTGMQIPKIFFNSVGWRKNSQNRLENGLSCPYPGRLRTPKTQKTGGVSRAGM